MPGNFTVIGPSGSGKTVVRNFLLAEARKYDPRIVFFDKDRGAELFLRAVGAAIELMARKKARARLDYNGDGAADDTGWLGTDDGFLVIDRNIDGLITEASELSLAVERDGARSGLQGLAAIDSNGDGIVDSDDARFGELRVWQDANGNGRTDQGELKTLAELDIVSINIGNVRATRDWLKLDRNAVFATTTFVRGDGTTSTAADISLAYRPARPVADRVPAWHDGDFESWRNLWRSPHHSFWKRQKLQEHRADLATIGTVFDRLRWGHRDTLADLFDQFDKASFPALPVPATGATPSAEKHASLPGPIGAFLPEDVDREAGQFSDHLEARLAKRLALIRQDMGNFGFKTAGETGPEDFHTANPMDWYS